MTKKKGSVKEDLPGDLDAFDTGSGVDFSLSDTLPNGELKTTYFASNKMPPLKVGTDNMKRTLKISYSSIADDNEQLLHFLFKKSKS